MLYAINEKKERCFSLEIEKKEGPFFCEECGEELILKKGSIKIHHFAHKKSTNCIYGNGETEEHYKIKKEIFDYFSNQENCKICEIEKRLNGSRPDVFLNIDNNDIAIEIQKSSIDINEIYRRTLNYSKLGIAVLWISPNMFPKFIIHKKSNRLVYNIKEWELFIHCLYYGRLYYWKGDGYLNTFHFEPLILKKEDSNWSQGYEYKAKKLKIPIMPKKYFLIKDFKVLDRNSFFSKNWSVPNCKIFYDGNEKWW
jgi:competence protein CoiA